MTDTIPHQSNKRREDLASDAVRSASFTATPGLITPVDLNAAAGDVTLTFPSIDRLHRTSAMFGVLIAATHATRRLLLDANGETVNGVADPDLSAFSLGDPAADRPELLVWQLLADGSWYLIHDGRIAPAEKERTEVVTSANVIAASETGKTFFLNSSNEFASTLPAPAAGLRFSFVVTAAPSGASYTIVTNSSANIIKGQVYSSDLNAASDGDIETSGGDTISFVDAKAVAGDRVDLICDGTNWFAYCFCSVFDAITITTAS